MEYENVECVWLAEDKKQSCAILNTIMNMWIQ
jgi:hypothetical protein